MKEGFVKNTGKGLLAWKLAIAKCFIKCLITGVGVLSAGLGGLQKFSDLTQVQWFCLWAGVVVSIAGVVDGFVSTTFSKTQADIKEKESDQEEDDQATRKT